MKKNFQQKKIATFLLSAFVIFLASCNKSDSLANTSLGTEETPLQVAVKDMSLVATKTSYHQASGGGEAGYRLHFEKSGKVTKLGCEMARTGTYTVSFWRTRDKQLLVSAQVVITDVNNFFYTSITPLDVYKDTSYVVSFHNPDADAYPHWLYTSSPFRNIYPFTKGNVVLDQNLDLIGLPIGGNTPTYPYTVYSSDQGYIGSSCDFVYQPLR